MPKSMEELRDQLSDIEADESTYDNIGPDEVPLLQQLLNDDEAWLAARAAFALSRIDTPAARDALAVAARDQRPEVRVAVAVSAERLSPSLADALLGDLLADPSPGVRKFAIRGVTERNSPTLRQRLQEVADTDEDPALRRLARERHQAFPP